MNDLVGRAERQEEVRQERRRRDDATIDGGQALKLAVPPDVQARLTEQNKTWRWANDEGNRIHRLTVLDDWDRVQEVPPVDVVIDKKAGTTCKAYLLSKPIAFVREDRAKKDVQRRAQEDAMIKGNVPNAGMAPASRPTNVYADTANAIGRGNQIIE